MQGILACCSPIPPLVRQHLLHLHDIILKAREMPLISLQNVGQPLAIPKIISMPREQDTEDPLHCVHDLTHLQDIRDDLPTLLTSASTETLPTDDQTKKASESIKVSFKSVPQADVFLRSAKIANLKKDAATAFTSPYARYTLAKSQALATSGSTEMERIERTRQCFLIAMESTGEREEQIGGSTIDANVALSKDPVTVEVTAVKAAGSNSKTPGVKKNLPLSKQIKKKRKEQKKFVENVTREKVAAPMVLNTPRIHHTTQHTVSVSTKKQPKISANTSEKADTISPFDYSEVNYKEFHKSAVRDEGQRRGKGNRNRGARGRSNGRVNRTSSQKSLTYSSK
jgi:exosome complex exonuclease RRP6